MSIAEELKQKRWKLDSLLMEEGVADRTRQLQEQSVQKATRNEEEKRMAALQEDEDEMESMLEECRVKRQKEFIPWKPKTFEEPLSKELVEARNELERLQQEERDEELDEDEAIPAMLERAPSYRLPKIRRRKIVPADDSSSKGNEENEAQLQRLKHAKELEDARAAMLAQEQAEEKYLEMRKNLRNEILQDVFGLSLELSGEHQHNDQSAEQQQRDPIDFSQEEFRFLGSAPENNADGQSLLQWYKKVANDTVLSNGKTVWELVEEHEA